MDIFNTPTLIEAANTNSSLYSNPNQYNSNDPYKFKVSDVVNSQILTSVVGCTGVVNKVAKWMSTILQSPEQIAQIARDEIDKKKEQLKAACSSVKAGIEAVAGGIPTVNDMVKPADTTLAKTPTCQDRIDATSDKLIRAAIDQENATRARDFKEQCFDGIAITLAKNQLTAMTRSAMNWVNSGFGGNPFFVQNMQHMTYNLEKNVINTGIDALLAPNNMNPYALDFAKAKVANKGIVSSSAQFLGGLQSDLSNFVTDPTSYYSDNTLGKAQDTRTVLQRAQQANNSFATNFMYGGWNGWLALTQIEKNNPLGFNMIANQYINEMESSATNQFKSEITTNNGFMSQKTCVTYNDDKLKQLQKDLSTYQSASNTSCSGTGANSDACASAKASISNTQDKIKNFVRECKDDGWKVITPGSLIKDKVTSYLGSPERQLEIAKTINDSLNAVFSVLISKLEGSGLFGLSDSAVNVNWTDNMNTLSNDSTGGTAYNNNGAYDNFDLTKNLGNTYIHDTVYGLGTWNAKDNITTTINGFNNNKKLYPNLAPEIFNDKGEPIIINNSYYTVDTPGTTKIMDEGYNVFEKGDRVFWDGTKWQNWKCGPLDADNQCTIQKSPIKKRGVIQLQQDYIVAAKAMIEILPNVMSKLGELDYCIPGPNPSYKTNSSEAQTTYQNWVGSIYVGGIDRSNERFGTKIDTAGMPTYEALHNIFNENFGIWTVLKKTLEPIITIFSWICDRGSSGECIGNSYIYVKNGDFDKYEAAHLASKEDRMKAVLEYVNSNLFPNFYEIFDKQMNDLYFKNMTSPYLEREDVSLNKLTDKNPGYIPMAENGLDLTKDIMYYNDEYTQTLKDLGDAVKQARVNIAKLEPIRDEVSGIIKAAQDRRQANLDQLVNAPNNTAILACEALQNDCLKGFTNGMTVPANTTADAICLKTYNTCIADKTASGEILSQAQLESIYKTCLLEEDTQFFEAEAIRQMGNPDAERCNDGIDNDLDGLIDSKDPDCPSTVTTNMKCLSYNDRDIHSYYSDLGCGDGKCLGKLTAHYSGTSCENRNSLNDCSATENVYAGPSFHFNWGDAYNSYKVKTCMWADVTPTNGQCSLVLGSGKEIHSYISDLNCVDGKCHGVLKESTYSPTSCERRGPNDCTTTAVITSGPKRVRAGTFGLDPYNAYTVSNCQWTK